MWLVPATILNNESFVRRVEQWAAAGGHLVVLLEHAAAEINDWRTFEPAMPLAPALAGMLQRLDFVVSDHEPNPSGEIPVGIIRFADAEFEVAAAAHACVAADGAPPGVFASVRAGAGRVSLLADARPLRNRWLGDHQHVAFLLALLRATERQGAVFFVRGSGLSFPALVRRHLWPVLCGLAVLLGLWLWQNLTRFGPLEAATAPSPVRGYDHHLEALGNFHWRLNRATALMAPLREQIVERGQRLCGGRSGRLDDELLEVLAARSGLAKERVARALAETSPADSQVSTRTVADLQVLLKVLT
jgi:hypothetical protein